jgi:hypothetical protein
MLLIIATLSNIRFMAMHNGDRQFVGNGESFHTSESDCPKNKNTQV